MRFSDLMYHMPTPTKRVITTILIVTNAAVMTAEFLTPTQSRAPTAITSRHAGRSM